MSEAGCEVTAVSPRRARPSCIMDIFACVWLLLVLLLRDCDAGDVNRRTVRSPNSGNSSLSTCGHGHLQGYVGTCPGNSVCLRKLQREAKTTWRDISEVDKTRTLLLYVPGSADIAHLVFVTLLTDFQWRNGVYGSVGELGTGEGRFTAVLSFNTDLEAGERLVLSDEFDKPTASMPMMAKLDSFRHFLKPWGFTTSGERRVYAHRGQSAGVDREMLLAWNLPWQFRLVSIDGRQDAVSLLRCLERAACILRDGGVVVVDDVDSDASPARSALKHFLNTRTRSAFSPLLLARDKLYLCTTNWRQRFARLLVSHVELVVAYDIKERTDSGFGPVLSYFYMDR